MARSVGEPLSVHINARAEQVAKDGSRGVDLVTGGVQASPKQGWPAGSWAPKRRAQGTRHIWRPSAVVPTQMEPSELSEGGGGLG